VASAIFSLERKGRAAHIWDMARERFESALKCPACGREGLADMSTVKTHKIDHCDVRVDAVTEGFSIKDKSDVVCSRCQISAL
jgi:hypothetical protein